MSGRRNRSPIEHPRQIVGLLARRSPLSGHASEASNTHIVMVTAFSQMAAIFGGTVPGPYNDYFVDGEAGTFPSL